MSIKRFLSPDDIAAWHPMPRPECDGDPAESLRGTLIDHDLWSPAQVAGRTFAMGCVSLEVTQRCNLDCSLCYLSDMAEAVHDLPLAEVLRRIDLLADHYGKGTNVQISGGDPTLRKPEELAVIVARIAAHGMRPALFTNGIKATRGLLSELASKGLLDVAFHVDLTQERKGYDSEQALNRLRLDYIQRAKGLGLRVLFNTTVFDGNVDEMPDLVRFFVDHADDIHLASFQLQADTGRGVHRPGDDAVSQERMMRDIADATGLDLDFEMPVIGHPHCNKYTGILVSNGEAVPLFDDQALFTDLFDAAGERRSLWHRNRALAVLAMAVVRPVLAARALLWLARKAWALRSSLLHTRRVTKLSFFIHNFMSAETLEEDRCASCVFMVATRDGPISMCVHNAKRDRYVLATIDLADGRVWDPLSGEEKPGFRVTAADHVGPEGLPLKRLKGRWRAKHLVERAHAKAPAGVEP
jgi:pyruvate-formate lyase-activating enzyme